MAKNRREIVHQKEDGKWYYWDECWAFEEGPYDTRIECEKVLDDYYKYLMKEDK